ncbi:hypothetical protein TPHA_0J01770 [Tetrapisispora phaffii CBS 4417]|uniref:Uncharacterized protein n=1 Tax=Tetrapisispora phaffii (strain ATCC 24235 / CBS 4417 / NBRC 1672 / NRRL Y-8282 / UCD 70-5) TaxID=1071381 RepID=G8BYQ6_TETPH|nr:hypothetical protein TPHA_0J01770 [Tetrapisispora phaffii CBS 4417]CCE64998.1 hypothetical protein TPHA_0J01770 [Tetrapisispora phaffii CBS 4417]
MTVSSGFCDRLNNAFNDKELDCISLVTIIDSYCETICKSEASTTEMSYLFLKALNIQLNRFHDVVYEIGWDLPKSIIGLCMFKDKKNVPIEWRKDEIFLLINESFDIIIKYSNPKEYFIAFCDMLSTSDISAITAQFYKSEGIDEESDTLAELSFLAQFFLIMNLGTASFKNIKTVYPSKFLRMFYEALRKYVTTNLSLLKEQVCFETIIYKFLADFHVEIPPKDFITDLGLSKSEYKDIKEEEIRLCNKILLSGQFMLISLLYSNTESGCDLQIYSGIDKKFNIDANDYTYDNNRVQMYCDMATKFGLDLHNQFETIKNNSKELYNDITNFESPNGEFESLPASKLNELIYHLAYTHEIKNLSNLKDPSTGIFAILTYFGMFMLSKNDAVSITYSLEESIYLYLHCSSCSIYSQNMNNVFVESVARYMIINSFMECSNSTEIKRQLSRIPLNIKNVFLQLLLMKVRNEADSNVRTIYLFIITQILASVTQAESFDFIVDTLLTCPFIEAKIVILYILKTLLIKDICQVQSYFVTEDKDQKLPALPPRPIIKLDDDIIAKIHSLYSITFESTIKDKKDKRQLTLLLSFLNLMIVLRRQWNLNLLIIIDEQFTKEFQDEPIEEELPEIGFIKISMETLKEFISTSVK